VAAARLRPGGGHTARFGAEGYTEIRRIRSWLTAQPQQAMPLAFLSSPNPFNP
jgi:hypothetical protein